MVEQRNIRLAIEYNGREFAGWQFQPDQRTIQGELEKAIEKLTGEKSSLLAAGRTDAGVHALGQIANFKTDSNLPIKKYKDGLNFYLPHDILIHRVDEVPVAFHARYDAAYRKYQYLVASQSSALYSGHRWEINFLPDIRLLKQASEYIEGEHDFSTFCVVASQKDNNHCIIFESHWRQEETILKYEITGNRFLHSMVRSLVGLMMRLGRGDIEIKEFKEIFNSGDHSAIKKVAPAHGLYLVSVGY